MGESTQIETAGAHVRIRPGTTVHVWDLEAGKSDTWLIAGDTARHSFIVKSVEPADRGGSHLTLVQPGFEREYELRVHSSNVAASPAVHLPRLRPRSSDRRRLHRPTPLRVLSSAAARMQGQAGVGASASRRQPSKLRGLVASLLPPLGKGGRSEASPVSPPSSNGS